MEIGDPEKSEFEGKAAAELAIQKEIHLTTQRFAEDWCVRHTERSTALAELSAAILAIRTDDDFIGAVGEFNDQLPTTIASNVTAADAALETAATNLGGAASNFLTLLTVMESINTAVQKIEDGPADADKWQAAYDALGCGTD